jgi:hypothetical protein
LLKIVEEIVGGDDGGRNLQQAFSRVVDVLVNLHPKKAIDKVQNEAGKHKP